MKRSTAAVVVAAALAAAGFVANANSQAAPAMPSGRLSIEMDVKPVEGQPGMFMVSSTVTDLESGAVVARPRLMIASDKPAAIRMGSESQWLLDISVAADANARTASYDATFTRAGKVASRQKTTINLKS